jgi:hypothetical protein
VIADTKNSFYFTSTSECVTKKEGIRWQDAALAISLALTGIVTVKVFLGSNGHGNNGNGHSPTGRMGRRGGPPPMLPPNYGPQPPPGYGMPPGAIPYGGGGEGGPPQRRRYPPQQQPYPPDQAGMQGPYQGVPTPGSQNTIGRQIMPQGVTEYVPSDQTVMGSGLNRIRTANVE